MDYRKVKGIGEARALLAAARKREQAAYKAREAARDERLKAEERLYKLESRRAEAKRRAIREEEGKLTDEKKVDLLRAFFKSIRAKATLGRYTPSGYTRPEGWRFSVPAAKLSKHDLTTATAIADEAYEWTKGGRWRDDAVEMLSFKVYEDHKCRKCRRRPRIGEKFETLCRDCDAEAEIEKLRAAHGGTHPLEAVAAARDRIQAKHGRAR
jgi:hypothetical protein